ncbi:hypothetical protein AD99_05092, partial [Klebsiella pneumoniae MGH 73]
GKPYDVMRQTRQYDTCKCVLDLVFLQQGT